MKKLFHWVSLLSLIVSVIFSGFSVSANAHFTESKEEEEDSKKIYLIKYKVKPKENKNKKKENIIDLVKKSKGKLRHNYSHLPMVSVEMKKSDAENLRKNGDIELIQENRTYVIPSLTTEESTNETSNWGLETIGVQKLNDAGFTGSGVKVAILDSGLDQEQEHPVLGNNVKDGASFSLDGELLENEFDDHNGHGTHVAGTIAGQSGIGIAENVDLYIAKVLLPNTNPENSSCFDTLGSSESVIAGINWAISKEVDIINMSLGFIIEQQDLAFEAAVIQAYSNGITVVSSAGNEGYSDSEIESDSTKSDTVTSPARFPEVITVAAIDRDGNRALFGESTNYGIKCEVLDTREVWSASGPSVDITAPGKEIVSYGIDGVEFATMQGTSMAAPHVTGLLALYKQQYDDYSPNQLKDLLINNAEDVGVSGWDIFSGHGLIKAFYEAESVIEIRQEIVLKPSSPVKKFYTTLHGNKSEERIISTDTKAITKEGFLWNEQEQRFDWYKVDVPELGIQNMWYRVDDGEALPLYEAEIIRSGRVSQDVGIIDPPTPDGVPRIFDTNLTTYIGFPGGGKSITGDYNDQYSITHVYLYGRDGKVEDAEGLQLDFYLDDDTLLLSHKVTREEAESRYFALPSTLEAVGKFKISKDIPAEIAEISFFDATSQPESSKAVIRSSLSDHMDNTVPYAFDNDYSTYWASNTPYNTTVNGKAYIGFELEQPTAVRALKMTQHLYFSNYNVTSVKAQYSNDGANWIDIKTFNNLGNIALLEFPQSVTAKYFRVLANSDTTYPRKYWGVRELEIVGKNDWLPPVPISSGDWSSRPTANAFDDNLGSEWWSLQQKQYTNNAWLGVDFGWEKTIRGMKMTQGQNLNSNILSVKIQSSNDGQNWDDIMITRVYRDTTLEFPEEVKARYFRVLANSDRLNTGTANVSWGIKELAFLENVTLPEAQYFSDLDLTVDNVPEKAFDNDGSTFWQSGQLRAGVNGYAYIAVHYNQPKTFKRLSILQGLKTANNINSIRIQSSNNGQEWNDIITSDIGNASTIDFPTEVTAQYFRVLANASPNGLSYDTRWQVAEVTLIQ